jgi:hypothetical protein
MNIWERNGRTGNTEQADSFNVEEQYSLSGRGQAQRGQWALTLLLDTFAFAHWSYYSILKTEAVR